MLRDILDLTVDLDTDYFVLENSSNIVNYGLCETITYLNKAGYIVEWETVAATGFGFSHYRHRIFAVAYKVSLWTGSRLLDPLVGYAYRQPHETTPICKSDADTLLAAAVEKNPKSVKLRTKRINALGDAVAPSIGAAVFGCIENHRHLDKVGHLDKVAVAPLCTTAIESLPWNSKNTFRKVPSQGIAVNGHLTKTPRCDVLNPPKTKFPGLFSTLISRDGNNNFTNLSVILCVLVPMKAV